MHPFQQACLYLCLDLCQLLLLTAAWDPVHRRLCRALVCGAQALAFPSFGGINWVFSVGPGASFSGAFSDLENSLQGSVQEV